MRQRFWKQDWFAGLLLSLLFLLLAQSLWLKDWEDAGYDLSLRMAARTPPANLAIIAIDPVSQQKLGGLPWSRDLHARVLDKLTQAGARLVASTESFSQARHLPGRAHLDDLSRFFDASRLVNQFHCEDSLRDCAELNAEVSALGQKIRALESVLDTDAVFAESLNRSGHFIMAVPVSTDADVVAAAPLELPEYLINNRLTKINDPFELSRTATHPLTASGLELPQPLFGEAVLGLGALLTEDSDRRRTPLVLRYQDQYYPSLALVLAAKVLNLELPEVEVDPGRGVRLGHKVRVHTDPQLRMRPFFYSRDNGGGFATFSFYDVYTGAVPAAHFRDRIVLIGPTPADPAAASPVADLAHSLGSILQQDFLLMPSWGDGVKLMAFALAAFYLSAVLPRLGTAAGLFGSAGLALLFLSLQSGLLMGRNLWLPLLLPALLVLSGHALLALKRAEQERRQRTQMDSETVAVTRLEGLAYQGQGRLELAFEKFTQCPPDELIMGLLYNLALDFERKRQIKQAIAVYRYMSAHNPDFRDITPRMSRLQKPRRNRLNVSGTNLDAWLDDSHELKPTLGRYQIERKIAKGAMGGDVYLGKDPKLDRMVALKTLALAEEFEGEELQEATARFFREAAAAGRLAHPNIVAVYDAGEEHDLAYISMEFFKGGNLVPYTQPDNLLPLPLLFDLMITAAEALDFAHQQGVVHRDIKPANILYNPAIAQIKLTDFGIARITDTKKTKTGVILGTPSYMSPEQLAGKIVDGHSDLFSLGVTLYQLACGELPFNADSMASLMFKIASEPHPDILSKRPDLPPCLKQIVDTLLQKDPARRYPSGADTAQHLRACRDRLNPGGAAQAVAASVVGVRHPPGGSSGGAHA